MKNIRFWIVLCVVMLGLCFYGIYRNNKVFSYRNQLVIQRMFVDIEYHDDFIEKIEKRYTYTDMFLSFKPLESKYWFTREEVEKYKLNLVDEAVWP